MDTPNNDNYSIGIDLGTTNCCLGVWKNNRVEIISNSNEGARITPSYVYIKKEQIVVGNIAKNQLNEFENLIYNVKRLICINFTDK